MTDARRGSDVFAVGGPADWKSQFAHLDRADIWAACAAAIVMAALSAWRIDATEVATLVNNCIFGADTETYSRWLDQGNYLGLGVKKHTLSVILIAMIASPLAWAGVPHSLAAIAAMAAVWGGVAAVAFLYFRRAGSSRPAALAFVTLALSSFGIATHAGIIETYGVTLLMIGIACLLLPAIARTCDRHPVTGALFAGGIGAGLALANAPSAAFILVYLVCLPPPDQFANRRTMAICAVIPFVFILLAIAGPALAAEGAAGATWHREYLERYARPENLMSASTLGNFLASVAVFSFVAPLEFVQCRFVLAQLMDVASRPLALAAYLGTISLVVVGTAAAMRSPRRREVLGLLGAVTSVLGFYLYFNPDEALLYSPQWVLPLFFAASPAFARSALWAGVAALFSIVVNLPPLHDARTFEPRACCPDRPASMLPREHPEALLEKRLGSEEVR